MFEMPSANGIPANDTDVMTIEEYNKRLQRTASQITGTSAETMVKIGLEAKRQIVTRIQKEGVDAKGKKYAPYSTKDTLIGSTTFLRKDAAQKVLGSKEKRKALEWRTVNGHRLAILPGGYKKIRELQGRQTDHVDFTVTGEMWNDINILKSNKTEVEIGAKRELNKNKLAGNTERRGDILDLSVKEIETLKRVYNLSVLQIFKENGL